MCRSGDAHLLAKFEKISVSNIVIVTIICLSSLHRVVAAIVSLVALRWVVRLQTLLVQ